MDLIAVLFIIAVAVVIFALSNFIKTIAQIIVMLRRTKSADPIARVLDKYFGTMVKFFKGVMASNVRAKHPSHVKSKQPERSH